MELNFYWPFYILLSILESISHFTYLWQDLICHILDLDHRREIVALAMKKALPLLPKLDEYLRFMKKELKFPLGE